MERKEFLKMLGAAIAAPKVFTKAESCESLKEEFNETLDNLVGQALKIYKSAKAAPEPEKVNKEKNLLLNKDYDYIESKFDIAKDLYLMDYKAYFNEDLVSDEEVKEELSECIWALDKKKYNEIISLFDLEQLGLHKTII